MLKVENLTVSFSSVPVVRGVSLEVEESQTLAIVGESGSGKSVTSLAVMGLLGNQARVEGDFRFQGERFSPRSGALRGHGLAMIFQNPMSSLNPVMKVGTQVAEPLVYGRRLSRTDAVAKVLDLFGEVGLPTEESFYGRYPHQLSGGMRQRVMIACALACDPRVLIADEPTTALDVTVQAQILDLLKSLQASRRMGMVMITHDMSVVRAVADRVAVMYAGQFVETGTRERVLDSPRHPYTRALLKAIPRLERVAPERLESIPGRPPAPEELGEGCPFAPRCTRAEEGCLHRAPELFGAGHAVRCLLEEG